MSRDDALTQDATGRFPRVSGDEPPVAVTSYTATRFSPRERG